MAAQQPSAEATANPARCWDLAVDSPLDARRFVEEALRSAGWSPGGLSADATVGELRLCRGYIAEQLGDSAMAATDYQAAVEDGERLAAPSLLAQALALRGEWRYYLGSFTSALEDLNRSYAMELELGRESRQNYVLNAIAGVYADSRVAAYDRALEYYAKVAAAHQSAGNLRELAISHFNVGSTLEHQGDLPAALAALEKALELDRSRGDADEVAFDQRAVASVLVKLARAPAALKLLDRSAARFAETADAEALAQVRLTRGIARRVAGDLPGSLEDLKLARDHFLRGKNDRYSEKVAEELSATLAAKGAFADALAAKSEQLELERALATTTRDEHTSRLRVQFDSERTEQENRALARENELKSQALRDADRIRSLQRVTIALAVTLVVVLSVLVARKIGEARSARRLAMTDELTRLPNRRALYETAAEALVKARSSGQSLALLALDIDHFKRINDTLGHAAGDRVLQRVANAARKALRETDALGRVGGEEFLGVLPDAGAATAAEAAERLRAAVEAVDVQDLSTDLRVTVSVGVALLSPADGTVDLFAQRADAALYRAKSSGRNRVELANEEPIEGP